MGFQNYCSVLCNHRKCTLLISKQTILEVILYCAIIKLKISNLSLFAFHLKFIQQSKQLMITAISFSFLSSFQRTLEREVRGCQALVVWTDCDREGENIGYEIIDVCRSGKFS